MTNEIKLKYNFFNLLKRLQVGARSLFAFLEGPVFENLGAIGFDGV